MNNKFLVTLSEFNMISHGDRVLIGVSGGADSMCLLSLFEENKASLGIEIAAAHVNHCIRGEEADRDEEFVKSYCLEHEIDFFSKRIDIPLISREKMQSTELCARNERYIYFESFGFDRIATAHTGSDCIETMLMNISRGSGLKGAASIPAVRKNIIRPLIRFTRKETENYCKIHNIDYVTDSSNLSDDYTRNKIRHNVIPSLIEINPSFEQNALRFIDSLREDSGFIEAQALELFRRAYIPESKKLSCSVFNDISPVICKRIIAYFFDLAACSDYEKKHIEILYLNLKQNTFSLNIPGGKEVIKERDFIYIADSGKKIFSIPDSFKFNKGFTGKITFGDYVLNIIKSDISDKNNINSIDFSKCDDIIEIRVRRPGDKINIYPRHCTKTLKKYYNELKFDSEQKENNPVISDSRGVIWVNPAGTDYSRRPDRNSTEIYTITMESEENAE